MDISTLESAKIVSLAESKQLVDAHTLGMFAKRRSDASSVSEHYETLWAALERLYASGGKRLRPFIALASYQAFGGSDVQKFIPIASALELIHQSMLVHDDIIDRDIQRYGVKNMTGQYLDIYANLITDKNDLRHFAESSALLAGDLLISEAHMQIARSSFSLEEIALAQELLSNAIFHVAGGELIDTEASFRKENAAGPLVIAQEKTAIYSFVTPLLMGASLAGANDTNLEVLKKIGNTVGIGFQLRDDIIGIFGDEAVTGKSADGDLREGKRTMIIEEFVARSTQSDQDTFFTYFGNQTANAEQLQTLRELLETSGTKAAVEEQINNYLAESKDLIDSLAIDHEGKAVFNDLATLCMIRNK